MVDYDVAKNGFSYRRRALVANIGILRKFLPLPLCLQEEEIFMTIPDVDPYIQIVVDFDADNVDMKVLHPCLLQS